MRLSNVQYDRIMKEYDEDRMSAEMLADERKAYIFSHIDGFKELSDRIASISLESTKRALSGDKSALTGLSERILELNRQKEQLLISNGFKADYLIPEYKCPVCKDTGYSDGRKCRCFIQKESAILYDQSGIRSMLSSADFNKLSERYYSGEDLERFRESRQKSLNFVNKFDSDYQNLLFYGTVGTGKSMLSSCIAGELLKKNHSVLYFSSATLMDELAKSTFDKSGSSSGRSDNPIQEGEFLYDCDLLIIDDLGTEMTNSFTISSLFTLLNERFLRKRPVIISTNLSLEELQSRYTDRIFSRLTGEFTFCRLSGPDIRIAHKFVNDL